VASDSRRRIAVIGGGIAGLSAAWRLRESSADVVLFEASPRPGGWIRTTERDGYLLEWGPHSVLPSSPNLISLAQEAGVADQWESADSKARRRYVYRAGRPRALPTSPFGIPFSTALSFGGWLRVLTEPFRSAGGAEGETVKDFFHRRLGREAAAILADAMVAGISGGVPEELEMASFAPAVTEMEKTHGSLFRGLISRSRPEGVPFRGTGTLRSGMQSLPEALARGLGEAYQGSVTVTEMYRREDGWNLSVEGAYDGDTEGFDGVILAVPSGVSAKLVRPHNLRLSDLLGSISYASMVLVQIAYDASKCHFKPNGFGFLVPRQQSLEILGAIWSSSIFPWRTPAGHDLATVFMGGTRDPRLGEEDDSRILETALADLNQVHGSRFSADWCEIGRAPRAIPQAGKGHGRKVYAMQRECSQLAGVELAGGYLDGISLENCARSGLLAAERILQEPSA
jgi:oxygen-dependent protoporphyrinogen oxidase